MLYSYFNVILDDDIFYFMTGQKCKVIHSTIISSHWVLALKLVNISVRPGLSQKLGESVWIVKLTLQYMFHGKGLHSMQVHLPAPKNLSQGPQ